MPDLNAVLQELPDSIFRRCVEDSSDAIMLTDTLGKIRYINKSWTELYGYVSGEALGRSPAMLHSGCHEREFYRHMWADILSDSKGFWSGEVINRAKDGKLKTVLLTITPFRENDRSGTVVGFMGLAVDLAVQKELQRRLEQQDKLSMIGTLASGIAHELGTPLGVIRGRAEIIADHLAGRSDIKGPANEILRRSAAAICDQVDRVKLIIERILGFARSPSSDAFGQGADIRIVEPRKTVQQIYEDIEGLVSSHFRKSGVRLEIGGGNRECTSTMGSAIEQILVNLLLNAVNAILSDGAQHAGLVRLVLNQCVGTRPVTKGTAGDEMCWVFAVEDSGPGVAEALRSRIFEPFFSTNAVNDRPDRKSSNGTGLGLAISRKISHDLGGDLILSQTCGLAGARFELWLPEKSIRENIG
jgi:PAS domain S-box-containing protein